MMSIKLKLLAFLLFSKFIIAQKIPDNKEVQVSLKTKIMPFSEMDREGEEKKKNEVVGDLVGLILETYMGECSANILKDKARSRVFQSVIRTLTKDGRSYTLFDVETTPRIQSLIPTDLRLQRRMRIEDKLPCQGFVIDLTDSRESSLAIQFLKNIELFLIPDSYVIFLGPKTHLESTLGEGILRNTRNVLYLVVKSEISYSNAAVRSTESTISDISLQVTIYSRCLYCNDTKNGIKFVNIWESQKGFLIDTPLMKDKLQDMMGHQLQIVQMIWAPLISFSRENADVSGLVTPVDSLHVRSLEAIAKSLNFTYEMREPWDCQWGVSTESGNWTGMIGTMQHHKADFGMSVTYSLGRSRVVDYTRIMLKEPLVLVMSKPRPRPPYLALINPFTGEVWAIALLSTVSAGLILWLFQIGWKWVSDQPVLPLNLALLYTWSIQFEEPATKIPKNSSSLAFIGAWWIYCSLITAMYKSSLVAHLSVPGKSSAIDSFEELLEEDGWTWGFGDTHSNEYDLLKTSDSPIMRKIFEGMEIQPVEEQAERILKEQHVLLIKEFFFRSLKSTIAKSRGGASPYYYGKSQYLANGDAWAIRPNAPFYDAIDMKILHLDETGLINHWLNEFIGKSLDDGKESTGQVILSLNHLQSAFFLLFIGVLASFVAFFGETILHVASGTFRPIKVS